MSFFTAENRLVRHTFNLAVFKQVFIYAVAFSVRGLGGFLLLVAA